MVVAMILIFGRRLQFTTQQVQSLVVPYPAGVQKPRLSENIVEGSELEPERRGQKYQPASPATPGRFSAKMSDGDIASGPGRSKLHPMIDFIAR
jgi:hypothetical protein